MIRCTGSMKKLTASVHSLNKRRAPGKATWKVNELSKAAVFAHHSSSTVTQSSSASHSGHSPHTSIHVRTCSARRFLTIVFMLPADTNVWGWARDKPSLGNGQEGICSTVQTLLLLLKLHGFMTDNGLGRKKGVTFKMFPSCFYKKQQKRMKTLSVCCI